MKSIDYDILISYLNGTASEKERLDIEVWISSSDENKIYFERFTKIWNSPPNEFPKPDTEQALINVLQRIQSGKERTNIYKINNKINDESTFSHSIYPSILKAAAIIIVMVGAVWLVSILFNNTETQLATITVNDIQQITLGDGTKVTLDAGSTLSYPKDFHNNSREVSLNGEAFFDVTRDESSPFLVRANKGLVKVLGTKFNIRAWRNKDVFVSVQEGKVSLKNNNAALLDSVVLTMGKMSRLSLYGTITEPIDVDINKYLSWLNKEIYFTNTQLDEVVDQLERWYKVNIEIDNKDLLQNRVTVYIENKPLEENLDILAALMNLKYRRDGNRIMFY